MVSRASRWLRVLIVFSVAGLWAASASANGAYVELQAGATFPSNSDLENSAGQKADLSYDAGYNVGGAAGVRLFDVTRAELGLHYRNSDTDDFDQGSGPVSASGDVGVFSAMANVYLDVDFWDLPVVPYVGAGLGLGVIFTDVNIQGTSLDDDDTQFAYNAMGGVAYEVTENWVARVGYRYFSTPDDAELPFGIDAEIDLHELVLGVRYEF